MRDVSLKKRGIILNVNLSWILLKYQKYEALYYVFAPRFKCSSTQKRDCFMPWRAFNIPWKMTEPFFFLNIFLQIYYSCLLNFHLWGKFTLFYLFHSKKRKTVDSWTDKEGKYSLLFNENLFLWGPPKCHTDKETEWPLLAPFSKFYISLSFFAWRHTLWRKTKTVFHMVLLSQAGTQYLQPTAMQQQQVCVSVWDRNKGTEGDWEGSNTPNGNSIKCEG